MKTDCEILDYKCAEVEKTKFAKKGNMVKKILMKVYYAIKRKEFDTFIAGATRFGILIVPGMIIHIFWIL